MSTTVTVQPNGSDATNWTNQGGAGSFHAALADDSDTTYAEADLGGSASPLVLDFASPSIPAGARVVETRIRARARQPAGGANDLRASFLLNGAIGISTQSTLQIPGLPWVIGTVIARSTKLDGTRWTEAELAGLQVSLHAGLQGGLELPDVDAEIDYEQEPTTTVATVSPASKPTITWTLNDPDRGDITSERAQVIIVADGVLDGNSNAAGSGSFDPTTAAQAYNSGDLLRTSTHQVATPLSGGDYWAYVRAAKPWSIDADTWYSPWDAAPMFTLVETAAKPPELVSLTAAADGAVDAVVRQAGNLYTFDTSLLAPLTVVSNALLNTNLTDDPLVGTQHYGFRRSAAGAARVEIAETPQIFPSAGYAAGDNIKASVWVKAAPGTGTEAVGMEVFIDEIGGGNLDDGTLFQVDAVESEWRQITQTLTLPALVGSSGWELRMELRAFNPEAGEIIWVDAPALTPGTDGTWSAGIGVDVDRWVAELQRSDDGTRWTTIPGTVEFDFGANSTKTLTDKGTAGRGQASYRVRTRPEDGYTAAAGFESDWGAVSTIDPAGALDRWDLWDLEGDTQIEIKARRHLRTRADRHHTFEPIGRSEGITHSETGRGEAGALTVRTYSAADHAALMTMLTSGRTLRLRDHLGGAWWIRVNNQPTEEQIRARANDPDWSTAYFHDVTFGWRQAGTPS